MGRHNQRLPLALWPPFHASSRSVQHALPKGAHVRQRLGARGRGRRQAAAAQRLPLRQAGDGQRRHLHPRRQHIVGGPQICRAGEGRVVEGGGKSALQLVTGGGDWQTYLSCM